MGTTCSSLMVGLCAMQIMIKDVLERISPGEYETAFLVLVREKTPFESKTFSRWHSLPSWITWINPEFL